MNWGEGAVNGCLCARVAIRRSQVVLSDCVITRGSVMFTDRGRRCRAPSGRETVHVGSEGTLHL